MGVIEPCSCPLLGRRSAPPLKPYTWGPNCYFTLSVGAPHGRLPWAVLRKEGRRRSPHFTPHILQSCPPAQPGNQTTSSFHAPAPGPQCGAQFSVLHQGPRSAWAPRGCHDCPPPQPGWVRVEDLGVWPAGARRLVLRPAGGPERDPLSAGLCPGLAFSVRRACPF